MCFSTTSMKFADRVHRRVYSESSDFSCCFLSTSSTRNLLDIGPALSGNELWGVCTGVGNGVDGYFGGDEAGVLYDVDVVMCSRNVSSCFSDSALCNVSSGRIGGTPPKPSKTLSNEKKMIAQKRDRKRMESNEVCFPSTITNKSHQKVNEKEAYKVLKRTELIERIVFRKHYLMALLCSESCHVNSVPMSYHWSPPYWRDYWCWLSFYD